MKSTVFIQRWQVAPSFVRGVLKNSRWDVAMVRNNVLSSSGQSGMFCLCGLFFFVCVCLYQRLTGGAESRCSVARKQRRVCCSFSPSETRGRRNTQNTHLPSSSCDLEQMNTDVLARLFRFHSRTLSTLLHLLDSPPPPRLSSTSSASSPSASSRASVFNLKSICPSAPTASSQPPFSCG